MESAMFYDGEEADSDAVEGIVDIDDAELESFYVAGDVYLAVLCAADLAGDVEDAQLETIHVGCEIDAARQLCAFEITGHIYGAGCLDTIH